ncbi:hypothetical protein [Methylorubrum extorquens]|nr:hypothetical protein [Methylorubrum extorquens]
MNRSFTVTDRSFNGFYVECAPGYGWHEMTPCWLDGQTLELGLSDVDYGLAGSRRRARARSTIPQLDEALKWCAERRMGVTLVCVEAEPHPSFVEAMHRLDEAKAAMRYRWPNVVQFVLGSEKTKTVASHRLVFKDTRHAFEFKMRWL